MKRRWSAAPFAVAVALAGCALLEPPKPLPPAPVVERDEARQVADLVAYYQRVAQMNAEDQQREVVAATQAFNRERSSYNRVRLAMIHLVPVAGLQDDVRAVQLLEPFAAGSGGALHNFANLIYVQAAERMKAQRRADQMKEQIDALRAIERSLIERGQQPRKP
jgi:hypothetical protein